MFSVDRCGDHRYAVIAGGAMSGRSQCSHCGSALASGVNYCSECGTPQSLIVLDRLGVEEPPVITGTDMAPHARLRMLAGLVLVVAILAVLWGLTRQVDTPDEAAPGPETPDAGIDDTSSTTSTEVDTTTTPATTRSPTTTAAQRLVSDAAGPILDDDVGGVLVQVFGATMRQIDLATGEIEDIDLEHAVTAERDESGIVVDDKLVAIGARGGPVLMITDLSDGSQREVRDIISGTFEMHEMHMAGRAGVDSVWLATSPEPDGQSEAVEVDLDGEILRRVEVPQPFEIRWADGDDLILQTVDGSWRYDTATGTTNSMPGRVVAFARGLLIMASCEESLQCNVLVDRGTGPEIVDWPGASELLNGLSDGPIDVSPDLSGALVHVYTQGGAEFTYIDLATGSTVHLGPITIDPYLGVTWVEGSRWIIGLDWEAGDTLIAVNTDSGTQIELGLPPSRAASGRFVTFIPSISASPLLEDGVEEEGWSIDLDDQGPGIHSVWMMRTFSPLREADVRDVGGRLVWEQTEIELCRIEVRFVGDGFLQIGDGFQTTEGCGDNYGMQKAFDDFGLPQTACIYLRVNGVEEEYCAPLTVD